MLKRGLVAWLLLLTLVSTACIAKKVVVAPTGGGPGSPAAGGSNGSGGVSVAGPRPPCQRVRTQSSSKTPAEKLPPAITKVADEVQQVRGLRFKQPVAAEAVSQKEIARQLQQGLNQGFPKDEAARTGQAWSTMGVIPAGVNLRKAVEDFNSSQVIGFYDDMARRLVIIGHATLNPYERFVLAHELTHALQDQNFNLGRLDQLDRTCQDERVEAFLSLSEGDAVETSVEWAQQILTPAEITLFNKEASNFTPAPASVPPFVQNLLTWPYDPGRSFVQALQTKGGEQAVDQAFRDPPTSTEQILHPDKYLSDRPVVVNVPNFAPRLGSGWKDLEFEDVGEAWFRLMLELRINKASADTAAAGWGGAQYRGWSDGQGQTAVIMDTVWDTGKDASEFAQAMDNWLGDQAGKVLAAVGNKVRVLFASDQGTLGRLQAAVSG
jgi:hypothetical protein